MPHNNCHIQSVRKESHKNGYICRYYIITVLVSKNLYCAMIVLTYFGTISHFKGFLVRYPHTCSDWANVLFHIGVQDYVSGLESEF